MIVNVPTSPIRAMPEHTPELRERPVAPVDVPASLHQLTDGRRWFQSLVGEAGAAVYRLARAGQLTKDDPGTAGVGALPGDLYLKHGWGPAASDVFDEAARLHWLTAHLPVPAIRMMIATTGSERGSDGEGNTTATASVQPRLRESDARAVRDPLGITPQSRANETWLLTDALSGRTAYEFLVASADAPALQLQIVDALADFLRRLHSIPAASCPFINDHSRRLIHARERLDAGLVDEADFGDVYGGRSAHQVWESMMALLPIQVDPVITHGDFSLDNLLLTGGGADGGVQVVGCIDVGRLGVADRYQDLAILSECLRDFDDRLRDRIFTQYGIDLVDNARLQFHLALDEFF